MPWRSTRRSIGRIGARTYERWAASVPDDFSFAVKVPKEITARAPSRPTRAHLLDAFLDQVAGLGAKLGVLLVQLPPSLAFDPVSLDAFFASFALAIAGNIASSRGSQPGSHPALRNY